MSDLNFPFKDGYGYDGSILNPGKLVLCGYCQKPIHHTELGGVSKKIGWFHQWCYLEADHTIDINDLKDE